MWRKEQVDSLQYRFGFSLSGAGDVPADFKLPTDAPSFRCGLFLPRDDAGHWGRYPARVILLCQDEIIIVAHPAAHKPQVRIPLDELEVVESAGILLLGWIDFYWKSSEALLSYNRRTKEPVDRFLSTLRCRVLAPRSAVEQQRSLLLGDELDLKFRNALAGELDGESVAVLFFRRPRERTRRVFGLMRRTQCPGNLLVATERRLLWITDRYRGACERYGAIVRYAALHNVTECRFESASEASELVVTLRSGRRWVVPAHEASGEARQFEFTTRPLLTGVFQ